MRWWIRGPLLLTIIMLLSREGDVVDDADVGATFYWVCIVYSYCYSIPVDPSHPSVCAVQPAPVSPAVYLTYSYIFIYMFIYIHIYKGWMHYMIKMQP